MPFLRFSRDKRGYEHTYLVQTTNRRGKPIRPRVLYWYRTPPGVRVGRPPFDAEVRQTLEAQNPGVVFDWASIADTPFPPQEVVEPWRERRRLERAARQARREEESPEAAPERQMGGADDPPAEGGFEAEPAPQPRAAPALPASTALASSRRRRRRGGRRPRGPAEASAAAPDSSPGAPADQSGSESSEDAD